MSEVPKEKTLSNLTKKELYDKCNTLIKIQAEYDEFKIQVEDYKTQLEVRGNYIQKLQKERDDLLVPQHITIMPSPHEILQDYKAKLHKEKTEAENFLKSKTDKCKMVEDLLNNLGV